MLTRQQIQDVCAAYQTDGWWVGATIPPNRLANARASWRQPPEGDVIAFADATLLGSGKDGLAVTSEGLVWDSGSHSVPRCSYGWHELAGVPVRLCGKLIQIGNGALFMGASAMDGAYLTNCLLHLQHAARVAGGPPAVAHVPPGRAFPGEGQPPAGGNKLQSLLEELAGDGVHVAPHIPERKVRNAREAMRIPPEESVLALVDTTVFGSAKEGMVVATRGIYWRNSFLDGGNDNGRLTWEALARARVARAWGLVILGEQDWIKPDAGNAAHLLTMERLVLGVQWWARARMAPEQRQAALAAAWEQEPEVVVAPLDDEPRWHLAVDGQSFGPYDTTRIGLMATAGQVNADTAYAWTEGMPGWTPLRQVPALAAVLPGAPAPAAPPAPAPAAPRNTTVPPRRAAPAEDEARIDINNAPLEDLLLLPTVNRARAELILRERAARGGFRDVHQVAQVLGLEPHQLSRLRRMVAFGRVEPSRGRLVDF
jgi:hypothetical protein